MRHGGMKVEKAGKRKRESPHRQTKGDPPRDKREYGKMHVVKHNVLLLPTCAHAWSLSSLYGTGQALRRRKKLDKAASESEIVATAAA